MRNLLYFIMFNIKNVSATVLNNLLDLKKKVNFEYWSFEII